MIKLYGFGKNLGLIDASPFVAKVHAFLKIAAIEYETINNPRNISKSPKGKLPYITDGETTICDSQLIIEYLTKKYTIELDSKLSTEQKASGYLIGKSLDENLYWCLVWSRWQHEATWKVVKKSFFKGLPFPISAIVPKMLQKKVIKSLYSQGTGRHSEQEIIDIANRTFQALSDLLGEKAYFFGDKPSSFDVTAYAFLASFTLAKIDNTINSQARSYENLLAYCNRMTQKYFN